MRGGERRRVVEAVADHEHAAALRLQQLDDGDLLGRRRAPPSQFAMPSAAAIGATAAGRSPDRMTHVEPARLQRRDHGDGIRAQRLADREHRRAAGMA